MGNAEVLMNMSREELERVFAERRMLLIEVRDEIDRRDRLEGRKGVEVDFTKYVDN